MSLSSLEEAILAQVHTLAVPQQRDILAFVRNLAATPIGTPGYTLLTFAHAIDHEAIQRLQQTMAEQSEQVDQDEW